MPRSGWRGRLAVRVLLAIIALVSALVAVALWAVHRSVPTLEGQVRVDGLQSPVTIARDVRGTAVVKGHSRIDVARGLGFVHAQERFFEMDLTRRSAAGELSELFGAVAIERDKARRAHRMRAMLTARLAAMDAGEQALLQAYADGVNAGLAQLGARPWQYLPLRAEPRAWQPVDSLLVIGEMFWMLQGSSVDEGLERAQWRDCVGDEMADWLEPRGGHWDAALDGSVLAPPALPGPDQLDLRGSAVSTADSRAAQDEAAQLRHEPMLGSNNWAVAGARSVTGDAMLANDMHLSLGAPSIWFRAQFEIGGAAALRAEGVTLPGVPALVAGSNGHVAWGFTNSYGQWADWVEVPARPDPALLTQAHETLHVKGGADIALDIPLFAGLPVVAKNGAHSYAVHWVADSGAAYSLALDQLLGVRDIDEALRIATRSGIPEQNFVAADDHGAIGWTIAGARLNTQTPAAANFGRFLPAADLARLREPSLALAAGRPLPSVTNPANGQLWTANARTYELSDAKSPAADFSAAIGDGGYDLGARAQQIRDRLSATPRFDEKMLGAIHFDDDARFMAPWRDRVAAVTGDRPQVTAVLKAWNGTADADQPAYRLLRGVRSHAMDALWAAWTQPLAAQPRCVRRSYGWHARFEYPVEQALDGRPAHLLPPGFASWDAFVLAQVDAAVADMTQAGKRPLAQATWGEKNASHIGHVLSRALPVLSHWLDMPSLPQAGDGNMPHVAGPSFGQSERLVVAPGHEDRATLAMPGGQSGHPMSPYYGAGHDDWVAGRPTPLLAGPPQHVLTLSP